MSDRFGMTRFEDVCSLPRKLLCAALAISAIVFIFAQAATARAETILAADRDWSEVAGWKVYWNAQNEGCFAEQLQAGVTQVLFGMLGKDNKLAIGFRNDALGFVKKDKSYTFKLRFDGRSSWDSDMALFDPVSGPLLLGQYGGAAKFRAETAKAGKLTIQFGKKTLASIALKGNSDALMAVDDCREAMQSGNGKLAIAAKDELGTLAESGKLTMVAITPDWTMKDMTVSELFATCPANFGTKPIEAGSEDFSKALLCYAHFLSLSNYLEETKQICPKLTYETQDVKNIVKLEVKFYKLLLVQVARAKRKNPSTKYQDVVKPMLQKRYPC